MSTNGFGVRNTMSILTYESARGLGLGTIERKICVGLHLIRTLSNLTRLTDLKKFAIKIYSICQVSRTVYLYGITVVKPPSQTKSNNDEHAKLLYYEFCIMNNTVRVKFLRVCSNIIIIMNYGSSRSIYFYVRW